MWGRAFEVEQPTERAGLGARCAEDEPVDAGLQRGPTHSEHGSRVTNSVTPDSRQRPSVACRLGEGQHLGVGEGIAVGLAAVGPAADDGALVHGDRADRHLAERRGLVAPAAAPAA